MTPLQPKFDLGKITVKDEAACALAIAGHEPSFFLERHVTGMIAEEDRPFYEQGLREGTMILSKYRTLRGHEILVATFPDRGETFLFCPPNSVIKYVPLPDLACWKKQE
jgi:hypothetical protein